MNNLEIAQQVWGSSKVWTEDELTKIYRFATFVREDESRKYLDGILLAKIQGSRKDCNRILGELLDDAWQAMSAS